MSREANRLTSKEKRIFLSAMTREFRAQERCEREGCDSSLSVVDDVIRKVINSYLWKGNEYGKGNTKQRRAEKGDDFCYGDRNEEDYGDS